MNVEARKKIIRDRKALKEYLLESIGDGVGGGISFSDTDSILIEETKRCKTSTKYGQQGGKILARSESRRNSSQPPSPQDQESRIPKNNSPWATSDSSNLLICASRPLSPVNFYTQEDFEHRLDYYRWFFSVGQYDYLRVQLDPEPADEYAEGMQDDALYQYLLIELSDRSGAFKAVDLYGPGRCLKEVKEYWDNIRAELRIQDDEDDKDEGGYEAEKAKATIR